MTDEITILMILLVTTGVTTWYLYKRSKRRKQFGDDYLIDSFL